MVVGSCVDMTGEQRSVGGVMLMLYAMGADAAKNAPTSTGDSNMTTTKVPVLRVFEYESV